MRQRVWRWCVLVAVVASLTSTLWLWQSPAKAATFLSEGISTTEIPADQTIDDDVYIIGGSATIAGHVLRNVFVVAGSVRITGTVDGDVNVLGNTVEVSGPVRGSVRAAGRTVRINGPVGWDALLLGQSVTLEPNAVVDHEVRIAGNDGLLQGRVHGDLRAALSQLTLQGQVDGTVHASVQTLTLGSGAVIEGDLDYEAPRQATIASGAHVRGATHYTNTAPQPAPRTFTERALAWLQHVALRLAWALIAGTLLVLLLPQRSARISATVTRAPLPSALWGIVVLFAGPLAALICAATIVGLPVAFLVTVVYLSVLYLSQVIVGLGLVRWILPGRLRSTRRGPLWIAMLAGTTVLVLIRLVPLPGVVGFWWTLVLSLLIAVFGLGAFWTDMTGWGLPKPAPAPAVVASPVPEVVRTIEEPAPAPEPTITPTEASAQPTTEPAAEPPSEPSSQSDTPRTSPES